MHRGAIGKLKAAASAFYQKQDEGKPSPFLAGIVAAQESGSVEVWEENVPVFLLFCDLQTQWNVVGGAAGSARTGLNYLVVFSMMERMELSKEDFKNMFSDIRVLEIAALQEMNTAQG